MYLNKSYIRALGGSTRNISVSTVRAAKNHYDSLEITPAANQADVKSAFYRLSMLYHPDKTKGSQEAAVKFREAAEAYEVLGNVRLRKLYDKGAVMGLSSRPVRPPDPPNTYTTHHVHGHRPPPSTGRTTRYDFTEWSRQHYGATFMQDMERKRQMVRDMEQRRAYRDDMDYIRTGLIVGFLMVVILAMRHMGDQDVVRKNIKKKREED